MHAKFIYHVLVRIGEMRSELLFRICMLVVGEYGSYTALDDAKR